MAHDQWKDQLLYFKEMEKPEAVLLLVGNAELIRITVAWMGMPNRRRRRLTEYPGNSEDDTWRWLWENTEYSVSALMNRIPGATEQTEQKFRALVANRILYPDGTVNTFVKKYLEERVLTIFHVGKRTCPGALAR